ncbi:ribonuclease D [Vibrio mangrovi]|uniref:Ribonuclease D n=1 Tax=Vibrio mangrovi TaxID=474394 RepID=A0A1Y6IU70_9VIBR|nr:ribonuclease D [Vibrio mangrovi]MDW6003615.1 ribonuclease D [Vibrio mangrovi]SMR99593.1 Ribonuclease D [Vibrio mangrovi]
MNYQIITSSDELEEVCWKALECPVVMLDTEFVRIRTFHAQLGLIQLYDGESVSLIDPMTIKDMTSFVNLLQAPQVLKVLHAAGEDLEVFHHEFGCAPAPFVDTQILAAFMGYGLSTGFAALVADFMDIELDKSESRTDWTARPLSQKQLDYAAADVFYLMPVYQQLCEKAQEKDWWEAALEESRLQVEKRTRSYQPVDAYLDIKGAWQLTPRQLAILKPLANWRYEEALKRNLALNFVIKEQDLLTIARLGLVNFKRMEAEGIDPRAVKRHGAKIGQLVKEGMAVAESDYPPRIVPISDYPGYKQLFKQLKGQVNAQSEKLNLSPEFLASRKQLNQLISWVWKFQCDPQNLPDLMQGWRKEILGDALYEMIPVL